ncbi:hypothetical protein PC128_g24779 [Phytophthora cactorum]|nr:hypothetical protein PC128_g24779 [Phytophthora cactorum]
MHDRKNTPSTVKCEKLEKVSLRDQRWRAQVLRNLSLKTQKTCKLGRCDELAFRFDSVECRRERNSCQEPTEGSCTTLVDDG